jgi:hypothetical protein
MLPLIVALGLVGATPAVSPGILPSRIARIVLHVPGGPTYERPERAFLFYTPQQTHALWRVRRFGTQWILWTDGTLWPRHPSRGEPPSARLPVETPADDAWRGKLAREAAPVYWHVYGENDESVGIEVAHSGRAEDPFPAVQLRALAWLLETLIDMSEGRLTPASVVGHKELDQRPAYVWARCARPGCPVFVDSEGEPYRRRVDPPETLFVGLAREGLTIPRPAGDNDRNLSRAEKGLVSGRPRVAKR